MATATTVQPNQVRVGELPVFVTFTYVKADGFESHRAVLVTETTQDYILGADFTRQGEFRRFKKSRIKGSVVVLGTLFPVKIKQRGRMMSFSVKYLLERAEGVEQSPRYTRINLHFGAQTDEHGQPRVGAAICIKVDRKEYDRLGQMVKPRKSRRAKKANEGSKEG